MKIMLTNSFYYPTFVGGAEISVQLLAEGLVKAGNQVYVLATGPQDKVYRANGVIVISFKQRNIFSTYNGVANVHSFFKIFWHLIDSCNFFYHFKLSAILKKVKPALVHTNNIQGFSPFIWLAIKANKIPLIHSMRDYYMLCHKCSLFNNDKNCETLCLPCNITHNIKKGFFKYPDHIVGISNYILNKHKSFFTIPETRSSVIYNATPKANNSESASVSGKLHFGFIGRVAKDKGVEYLANELSNLSVTQKRNIKIVFAGKGDADFIEELKIKLAGIEVDFLGVAKPAAFYKQIDVLIVPALWKEPFGRTVIESLSYAVPVCQTDRGGLKELYDPASSWMFSPEKGELLAVADHILKNTAEVLEKKKNAIKRADQFSVEKYISNHINLYNQILGIKPQQDSYKANINQVLNNQIS